MNSEQCVDDKLILGGRYSNITMMDHTVLPKYQTIEIKKTSKTSENTFDSIKLFGIAFLDPKTFNLATKIA